ncbi:hypothetical protein pqer_cds_824 [Pandoravirus quercus]|uniref:DUF5848 domain-containing protein n=1 Tax=Pandoravirus quercus TaxID=2107709 RepID=A0A2U7U9Y9_9VIRU|nr:hypothetical protein pqer_cds_824 [Pandoravirus quercus]AVK75246.1 hypothetical protein pqer_cds_824 [Pandoravirus quercus]
MNGDPMDADNHNGSTTAAMVSLSALQLWRVCPDSSSTARPASLSQRRVLDVLAAGARVPPEEATCANLVPLYTSFWSALNDLDAAVPGGIVGLRQPLTPLSVLATAGRAVPPGYRGAALAAYAIDTLMRLSAGETWSSSPSDMFLDNATNDDDNAVGDSDESSSLYTIYVHAPDAAGTRVSFDRAGQHVATMQLDPYGSVVGFEAHGRRRLPRRVRNAPEAAMRALMNSAVRQVADSGATSGVITLSESQLVWDLLSRSRPGATGRRGRHRIMERSYGGANGDYASEEEGETEDD